MGMDRSAATYWTSSWAEPHARGDGPTKEGALTGTDSRAPRTWGWTAGTGKRPGSSPPSPTHVGMDRFPEQGPQSSRAEPHARGDGPPRQGTDPPSTLRAPRTWGRTVRQDGTERERRLSPTHAGMKSFCDSTRSPRGASGCWFQQIFAIPQKMSEADHMVLLQRLISLQGGSR